MPDYFPQINGNLIMTQLPFTSGRSYETVVQDLETGPRFTFPRRGAALEGFPENPLWHCDMNYTNITDDEVASLKVFFDSMRGKWGRFRVLDPGGNLLKFSEDFTQSYWSKTGASMGATSVSDPFNGALAMAVQDSSGDAKISAEIGPSDGGMSGFVMCASIWVNARDSNKSLFVGLTDGTTTHGRIVKTPFNRWTRIDYSTTIWTDDPVRAVFGGQTTWAASRINYLFGAQVSPMKGPGGYVKSPWGVSGYGYHENCRFDVDEFTRRQDGPNQNSLQLPIVEVNA